MGLFSNIFGKPYSVQPSSCEAGDLSSTDHNFTNPCSLWVGVGGDLKVDLEDGGVGITFKNLSDGQAFPYAVKKVYKTGTTATDIVGAR